MALDYSAEAVSLCSFSFIQDQNVLHHTAAQQEPPGLQGIFPTLSVPLISVAGRHSYARWFVSRSDLFPPILPYLFRTVHMTFWIRITTTRASRTQTEYIPALPGKKFHRSNHDMFRDVKKQPRWMLTFALGCSSCKTTTSPTTIVRWWCAIRCTLEAPFYLNHRQQITVGKKASEHAE